MSSKHRNLSTKGNYYHVPPKVPTPPRLRTPPLRERDLHHPGTFKPYYSESLSSSRGRHRSRTPPPRYQDNRRTRSLSSQSESSMSSSDEDQFYDSYDTQSFETSSRISKSPKRSPVRSQSRYESRHESPRRENLPRPSDRYSHRDGGGRDIRDDFSHMPTGLRSDISGERSVHDYSQRPDHMYPSSGAVRYEEYRRQERPTPQIYTIARRPRRHSDSLSEWSGRSRRCGHMRRKSEEKTGILASLGLKGKSTKSIGLEKGKEGKLVLVRKKRK